MVFLRNILQATVLLLGMASAALAGAYEEALPKFANDSYVDTDAAIGAIAGSGNPLSIDVVESLRDGRLLVGSGQVFFRRTSGELVNAATGQAWGNQTGELKPVRVNNRVRRAIEAALGSLTLLSSDAAKRLEAARAVFRSRDEATLPTLEKAIAQEGQPHVRNVLESARAAILLSKQDALPIQRLAAVQTLRNRGDQEALALLSNLPSQAPPEVIAAAGNAADGIRTRLAFWEAVQNVWYGISLGSVLLLAAIGLAITFGTIGVINMAHGEMVMLGAYTTFMVQELIRSNFPGLFEASLLIALPLAFLVASSVGILIERTVIRFLYGRPLETLLATWGISLILQQGVRTIFGPTNREVGTPAWMSGALDIGAMSLTYNRIAIVVFAFSVFAILLLVLRYTSLGLYVRAVTQNRRMAGSMGIRTSRVDALAFGLGSGVAGIAGVALSQIDNVSPNLGQGYIIDSFMVVVFGGVGNLWGTLVGAMTLGIANKLLEPYAGAVLGKIALLIAIIVFIQRRPRGLFALKGRAVET
ncbi:urea ABC transporter permease subunit UrtB [Microvirga arsenatis]|uniref:Urea ABC transporter permease subunit UrtB n=1 Tax=Microvirga arsenatis TaxID=2692265 RepID=A0ABW9Z1I7_9HYPH|nr:urea ABC transporter permease subunit UrtB [Microvirga arsenatis]NBJ11640.1 urea ABC transporter permease subunit UrtB [Microvirga arsenatis]NBJ24921.1 urea ABC transporter permease subunit UrtB [Microvirga arsenatis]